MKKPIFVVVGDYYDGIEFNHTLVSEGGLNAYAITVEVTDKQLQELDELKKARDRYESLLGNMYDRAMKARAKKEEQSKCKYRLRPGKLCGAQTVFGSDRCPDHFKMRNPPNRFEVDEDEHE